MPCEKCNRESNIVLSAINVPSVQAWIPGGIGADAKGLHIDMGGLILRVIRVASAWHWRGISVVYEGFSKTHLSFFSKK